MADSDPIRDLAAATRDLPGASQALSDRAGRARLLDAIAAALDSARAEIIQTTAAETALMPEELAPEFDRMTGTLRMFAALVREGSWVRAAIDTLVRAGETSIGPNHDIRRMLVPLGPVAVFGASNFPLAYGVCGGDTASALAAGCPVIVKEHPAHPKTGRLIKSVVDLATSSIGIANRVVRYLPHEDPQDLNPVRLLLPCVRAVGFTGSNRAGLAIESFYRRRRRRELGRPPVHAEMGSVNVVVVTADALQARAEGIADDIADSILARFGQQCTRPGIVFVPWGKVADAFVARLGERIRASAGRDMLAPWIRDAYQRRLDKLGGCEGVTVLAHGSSKSGPRGASACLLEIADLYPGDSPSRFVFDRNVVLVNETLREEIFGPAAIVVRAPLEMVPSLRFPPALTLSLFLVDSSSLNDPEQDRLREFVACHAGRVTFNSVPTGVRVCTSMVHGGPFPATNRPDTTAVGPLAIERWCRPVCFQNCPDALLPPELQDANPLGIWRTVNGEPTRDPIRRGR